MTDLGPDARDLIAQARRRGPELLGPSLTDKARVRDKLTPLWAAAPAPRASRRSLRRVVAAGALLAGVGLVSWQLTSSLEPPQPPAAQQQPATAVEQPTARALPELSTQQPAPAQPSAAVDQPTAHALPDVSTQQPAAAARRKASTQQPAAAQLSAAMEQPTARALPKVSTQKPAAMARRNAAAQLSTAAQQPPASAPQQQPTAATPPARTTHTPEQGPRTPTQPVQSEPDPTPPSIEGELELLGSAQAALQAQQPSRALKLLQEHAFRFPKGALIEERMAMQALALCTLQRRTAALAVLSSLEARGSKSQLLPRIRTQCGL